MNRIPSIKLTRCSCIDKLLATSSKSSTTTPTNTKENKLNNSTSSVPHRWKTHPRKFQGDPQFSLKNRKNLSLSLKKKMKRSRIILAIETNSSKKRRALINKKAPGSVVKKCISKKKSRKQRPSLPITLIISTLVSSPAVQSALSSNAQHANASSTRTLSRNTQKSAKKCSSKKEKLLILKTRG